MPSRESPIELLTAAERDLLNAAGALATKFRALPQLHPSDRADVAFHVHAVQNIVLARSAYGIAKRVPPGAVA